MLGLFLFVWLGSPPAASPNDLPPPDAAPPLSPRLEPAVEGPAPAPAPPPEPPPAAKPRRTSKGQRLLIGAGVAYGLGSSLQWATAGASGMLEGERPGGTSAVTLGMTLGGMAMAQGLALGAIGGRDLARHSTGADRRAKPLIAGGVVVASLGAGAVLGSVVFLPTIRRDCPIDVGCTLAGAHLGGAALSVGVGMMSYGHHLLLRDPDHHRLSKRARHPLIGGGVALGTGYILSAALGLSLWQEAPRDRVAIRTRNRMLIPVVGPWIHAAGPDARLFVAMITGGLGAVQIAGAIALAVGSGLAGSERRRHRDRERVQVRVVPRLDGVAVFGRF